MFRSNHSLEHPFTDLNLISILILLSTRNIFMTLNLTVHPLNTTLTQTFLSPVSIAPCKRISPLIAVLRQGVCHLDLGAGLVPF